MHGYLRSDEAKDDIASRYGRTSSTQNVWSSISSVHSVRAIIVLCIYDIVGVSWLVGSVVLLKGESVRKSPRVPSSTATTA